MKLLTVIPAKENAQNSSKRVHLVGSPLPPPLLKVFGGEILNLYATSFSCLRVGVVRLARGQRREREGFFSSTQDYLIK
jgi:hypothetical protein